MGFTDCHCIFAYHDAPGELLAGEGGDVEPLLGEGAELVPLPHPHPHLRLPDARPLLTWPHKQHVSISIQDINDIITQALALDSDYAPLLKGADRTLDLLLLGEHEEGLGGGALPLLGGQPHPARPGVLLGQRQNQDSAQ